MEHKQKAFSSLELLIVLSIFTILCSYSYISIKKLSYNFKKNAFSNEVYDFTQNLITTSRILNQNSSIFITQINNQKKLIFKLNSLILREVKLEKNIALDISLSSGSIFKGLISIEPSGYVSPSSIKINFTDNSILLINISRFGHAKKVWI